MIAREFHLPSSRGTPRKDWDRAWPIRDLFSRTERGASRGFARQGRTPLGIRIGYACSPHSGQMSLAEGPRSYPQARQQFARARCRLSSKARARSQISSVVGISIATCMEPAAKPTMSNQSSFGLRHCARNRPATADKGMRAI